MRVQVRGAQREIAKQGHELAGPRAQLPASAEAAPRRQGKDEGEGAAPLGIDLGEAGGDEPEELIGARRCPRVGYHPVVGPEDPHARVPEERGGGGKLLQRDPAHRRLEEPLRLRRHRQCVALQASPSWRST